MRFHGRHADQLFIGLQVSYSSLQGIALLLMLGYTMYDLVFDAKLGIIARTLYRAMPDLAHYLVIALLLVFGVTMASHVTMGPMLPAFDTFSGKFLTCCSSFYLLSTAFV